MKACRGKVQHVVWRPVEWLPSIAYRAGLHICKRDMLRQTSPAKCMQQTHQQDLANAVGSNSGNFEWLATAHRGLWDVRWAIQV